MHVVKVNAITKSISSTVTGLEKKWQTSNDMQIYKSMTTFIKMNQSDSQANTSFLSRFRFIVAKICCL